MTSMEETVYEVEQIDDDREIKGKKQYFIKWRNFPVSDNTWEPEENLDCPDLIARYEEAKKQRAQMGGSASTVSKEYNKIWNFIFKTLFFIYFLSFYI